MIRQLKQNINDRIEKHITLFSITRGILFSYLITMLLFVVLAYILTFTRFPEKYISCCITIVTFIGILIASSTSTRGLKNKGFLNGAVVGMIYMMLLYIASSISFRDFSIELHTIMMLILGIITGSIGGIIGINLKRNKKTKHKNK